jgi:glutamate racemase
VTDSIDIGVLDSGVGGLSVLREIRGLLPDTALGYIADSAFVPYGRLSAETIIERTCALADIVVAHGARMVVVACNTATAAAVPTLRTRLEVPVVGMEPAVKPAAQATRNGTIGVLATVGTLNSARFAALLDRFAGPVEVITQPCPGLVECVERGDLDSPETRLLVRRFVEPVVAGGADTLILGCTHYPFLRPVIEDCAGPGVALVDTGRAVARQVARVWESQGGGGSGGSARFWTSGSLAQLRHALDVLWAPGATAATLPGDGGTNHA